MVGNLNDKMRRKLLTITFLEYKGLWQTESLEHCLPGISEKKWRPGIFQNPTCKLWQIELYKKAFLTKVQKQDLILNRM